MSKSLYPKVVPLLKKEDINEKQVYWGELKRSFMSSTKNPALGIDQVFVVLKSEDGIYDYAEEEYSDFYRTNGDYDHFFYKFEDFKYIFSLEWDKE